MDLKTGNLSVLGEDSTETTNFDCKPIECLICSGRFTTNDIMKQHQKRAHEAKFKRFDCENWGTFIKRSKRGSAEDSFKSEIHKTRKNGITNK